MSFPLIVEGEAHTHLTAAFQLTGYPTVIGTRWPINDTAASNHPKLLTHWAHIHTGH